MAIDACNPSRRENKARRHGVPGQFVLHRVILSQNKGKSKSDHETPLFKASEHQRVLSSTCSQEGFHSLAPLLHTNPKGYSLPDLLPFRSCRGLPSLLFSRTLLLSAKRTPVLQVSGAQPASVMPPLPVTSLFSFTHATHSLLTACVATSSLVS